MDRLDDVHARLRRRDPLDNILTATMDDICLLLQLECTSREAVIIRSCVRNALTSAEDAVRASGGEVSKVNDWQEWGMAVLMLVASGLIIFLLFVLNTGCGEGVKLMGEMMEDAGQMLIDAGTPTADAQAPQSRAVSCSHVFERTISGRTEKHFYAFVDVDDPRDAWVEGCGWRDNINRCVDDGTCEGELPEWDCSYFKAPYTGNTLQMWCRTESTISGTTSIVGYSQLTVSE